MEFVPYAERAARLVNADLADISGLLALLADRPWLQPRATEADVAALRELVTELRPVFEASQAGHGHAVVDLLNGLLAGHPVVPQISPKERPDEHAGWHLHVATGTGTGTVADLLAAESLMGLATLVCELGPTRLGVCDAQPCTSVFVDTSPNQSRRYCSDRCSSRTNVAAYRARQRGAHPAKAGAS